MSKEEARNIKSGDRVRLVNYPYISQNPHLKYNGAVGYIPFVDRIYDEEPHAVVFNWTLQGCYQLVKIEYLELIGGIDNVECF